MRKVLVLVGLCLFLTACSWDDVERINETELKDYSSFEADAYEDNTDSTGTVHLVIEPQAISPDIRLNDNLTVGAFNIQVFGIAKMANENVAYAIADIIDDYDIMGVQEIRDKSGSALRELHESYLPEYSLAVSGRLGRSTSKEQYAFFYRPPVNMYCKYTFPDENDVFEREPFIANFGMGNTTITLVLVHIKPTDAVEEIGHLAEVVEFARDKCGDDDIFIMGDLNADCSYYDGGELSDYTWMIPDGADTTTGTTDCAYDRIVSVEYYSDIIAGVDFIIDETGGNFDLIEAVSDHYPVFMKIEG